MATECLWSTTVSKRPGRRVRGTCSEGHVTEDTSAAGRVTQDGPCTFEGCELPVHRTRIPSTTPPAAAAVTEDAGADDPYRVERVKIHASKRRAPQREPEPDEPDDEGAEVRVRGAEDAGRPPVEPLPVPRELEREPRGPRAG